ncbi:hypothetical protein V1268_000548 [Enterococcus hirae]|uniref:hypothetical protein n=1 Tax=Enterococcus TaxID=1350 RepID=UPI0015989EA4|nr:hypothetical protein [Enterococcus hirae]EMF0260294.1 hypothetical protein [Enterococcus hirae]MBA5272341.1 hypothetical protein [Enterococcus hirae]MDU1933303.1 hypothetical protein [Enterococcus hirae]QKX70723.1 hypothetical protein HU257_03350 [Enterococcus hirae]
MESYLNLNSNAYFYSLEKALSKRAVTQIAGEVSQGKKGNFKCSTKRKTVEINNTILNYSLFIFELIKKPNFLLTSRYEEKKYGYLLLIEYDNYLIVNSKYANGLKKVLENYADPLEYDKISRFLLNETTEYKKLLTQNTNISSYVSSIRRRAVEANNLVNSFSPVNAGKQLVKSMAIKTEGKNYSLSMGTSKINEKQPKIMFSDFCLWAVQIVDKLKNYNPTENYLENFAQPTNKELLLLLKPTTILFSFVDILEIVSKANKATYISNSGNVINIKLEKFVNIFKEDKNSSFSLIPSDGEENLYKIKNNVVNDLVVKKNKKSMKIHSKKLQRILIDINEESINFCDILNLYSHFIINFEDLKYAYSDNELFYDHQMEKNMSSFLSIFEPYPNLENIVSEKGKTKKDDVNFPQKTLFNFIENTFSEAEYLICDDLGNEIADYISFSEDIDINLYHAKSDYKKKFSASSFHIVVSQALKNLGGIIDVNKMNLSNKKKVWGGNYANTKISRLHTKLPHRNVDTAIEVLKKNNTNPLVTKSVWLVVDFISKKELEKQIKNGPDKIAIQLIWLLSCFVAECSEVGVKPRIACKP